MTELRSVDPDNKKLPKQKLNYDLMNAGEVPFKVENNKLIINGVSKVMIVTLETLSHYHFP